MGLVQRELVVIVLAYLLAAIPIGGAVLAGRMSPMYQLPAERLCRYWSWFALGIVASTVVVAAAGL